MARITEISHGACETLTATRQPVTTHEGKWPWMGVLALLLSIAVVGCAAPGPSASSPELVGSGWRQPSALAPVDSFDDYVSKIHRELQVHRLPFDASRQDIELAMVAPFRTPPGPACSSSKPRGVAILIHGLSDTAFAMRDLARSLSAQCLESRALLLPGHGTREADLMAVDHQDWLTHVQAAVKQARREHDFVVVAGFSLGAALALAVAAEHPGDVDAVIGLSPAYRIRASFLARQAWWIAPFRPWLHTLPRQEFARYGAMPTQGIASTMSVLGVMDARIRRIGAVRMPWFVVQSEDDEVVDVAENRRFFDVYAGHQRSRLVNYVSGPSRLADNARTVWLPAAHTQLRVVGMSHLAVHTAPENTHYGISGTYRNCGTAAFREAREVVACQKAAEVWYGVGGQSPPPGQAGARATFNPHYADMEHRIGEFLEQALVTAHERKNSCNTTQHSAPCDMPRQAQAATTGFRR